MTSGNQKSGTMKYEEWIVHWGKDDAPFHFPEPDDFLDECSPTTFEEVTEKAFRVLVKNEAKIFAGKTCSVFLPLCGKTEDINWLYNKGHTVVGVEISEKACSDFFKEHKIDPEVEAIPNVGNLYRTKDKRIQLYASDIFNITRDMVGKFDMIWDSGALSVINKDDRPRYFKLMKSLMTPDTVYFVNGADYDKSVWPGPPHPLNVKELTDMCGDLFTVEMFHQMNAREQQEAEEPAKHKHGETKPAGGAPDKGQGETELNFDDIEKALDKSSYLYFTYHRLTQK